MLSLWIYAICKLGVFWTSGSTPTASLSNWLILNCISASAIRKWHDNCSTTIYFSVVKNFRHSGHGFMMMLRHSRRGGCRCSRPLTGNVLIPCRLNRRRSSFFRYWRGASNILTTLFPQCNWRWPSGGEVLAVLERIWIMDRRGCCSCCGRRRRHFVVHKHNIDASVPRRRQHSSRGEITTLNRCCSHLHWGSRHRYYGRGHGTFDVVFFTRLLWWGNVIRWASRRSLVVHRFSAADVNDAGTDGHIWLEEIGAYKEIW